MMRTILSLLLLATSAGAQTFSLNGIPQNSPETTSGDCKITNTDVDGNYHVPIPFVEDDEITIAYLTATLADNQLTFQSFPYHQGDKITRTQIWIGSDANDVPLKSNGDIDHEDFPYMECNSTGVTTFEVPTDDEVDCHTGTLTVVVFVEILEVDGVNHMKSQDVFFEIDTACDGDCSPTTKSGDVCEDEGSMSLVSNKEKECHNIVAGSALNSMKAGEVCVQVVGDVLDVVFESDEDWAMLRSQVWVGQELAANASSALEGVPRKKSGAPDTRKFTNFECDWEGLKRIQFEINLKYHCQNEEQYQITVVAHSTVEQVDNEGNLIPGTELDVFAFEHDTTDTNSPWYGWFDFMIGCKCPTTKTKKFPAPPKDTPSPTPSPTGTPTASPSAHPSFAVTSVGTVAPTSESPTAGPTVLTDSPTETLSDSPTITASDSPSYTPSIPPTASPSIVPTITASGAPTETPVCLESEDDPWDALCFPLMATEAWKPDAGQVCISMAEYGTGNMNVSFALHEQSFWTLWEANVWIGSESEAQDVPRDNFGNIDASLFPFKETVDEGVTSMDVKSIVAYECEAGMEHASMTLIAHAIVAEQCIPPNGTYKFGSNFDAYGVDGSMSSETDAYIAIPFTVNCNCMDTPTTRSFPAPPKDTPSPTATPSYTPTGAPSDIPSYTPTGAPSDVPSGSPSAFITDSPTETPLCMMDDNDSWDMQCYPLMATDAWKPEAGQVCISMSEYGTGNMNVTYTLDTTFWSIWEAQVWIGQNLSAVPRNSDGKIDPSLFPYEVHEDGVNETTVQSAVEYACEDGMEYVDLTLVAHTLVGEQCIPPTNTYLQGSEKNAYGVDVNQDTESEEYLTLTFKVDCNCVNEPPTTKSFPSPPKDTPSPTSLPSATPTVTASDPPTVTASSSPTATPSASPTVTASDPPTITASSSPTGSPTKSPTDGPTASPSETPSAAPSKKPTDGPTPSPSETPTASPSSPPTKSPTGAPSETPSSSPSKKPTDGPTPSPSETPSASPSSPPTKSPTGAPSETPSSSPSKKPTDGPTATPSESPSDSPTKSPTASPSSTPSDSPTKSPTASPSSTPSDSPTKSPTASPSASPSKGPTSSPTASPSSTPSNPPTSSPTASPSKTPTGSPSKGPTGSPTVAPTTGSVDTCIDTATIGNNGCFNLTAYGFTGIPPAITWEGYLCVGMTQSEELSVTFSSVSDRKMWFASVWAGTDMADMPMLSDGVSPDANAFPWGGGSTVVEQAEYTTTVTLDSAASCSASGSYTLKLAAFAEFADPCVPPTGNFLWNSDEPVWAQDVENYETQKTDQYTWLELPITCDCVPAARRLQELDSPLMLRGSEFGDLDNHFEEVDRSGWTPSGRSLRRRL